MLTYDVTYFISLYSSRFSFKRAIAYFSVVLDMIFRCFIACGHFVFREKFGEVFSTDTMVSAGESERRQLPGTNPPQDGGITNATALGNKTDRDIFWEPLLNYFLQANLPIRVMPFVAFLSVNWNC
jgi:hypothetical protein